LHVLRLVETHGLENLSGACMSPPMPGLSARGMPSMSSLIAAPATAKSPVSEVTKKLREWPS